jgi:hypothetical protein
MASLAFSLGVTDAPSVLPVLRFAAVPLGRLRLLPAPHAVDPRLGTAHRGQATRDEGPLIAKCGGHPAFVEARPRGC